MKKKTNFFIILALIVVIILTLGISFFWNDMTMNTIDKYKPYAFSEKKLSNGMEVLLVRDPELPYISIDMMFKTGFKMDPPGKEGLTYLLTEIIDKGSLQRSPPQMIKDIELLGTSFYYDLDADSLSFSIETLSWLNVEALSIFSEIIRQPAFLEEEFQRVQQKAIGRIKTSPENFSYFASRAFNKYLYGEHPYGFYSNGSLDSLKNIRVEDVREFYNKYFDPTKAILSVSGRYPEDIVDKLEMLFGSWKKNSKPEELDISISAMAPSPQKKLQVINQKAAIQSEIRMGHISVARSHPDYLALKAANIILGGSFNSRLMDRIRIQKGLTYGIRSSISAQKEMGSFKLGLAVRNSKLGTALIEILGVLEDVHQNGITKEELDKAIQLLKNHFITSVATGDNFSNFLLYLSSQDIPYSYAEEYFEKLNQLTLKKVNETLLRHLHPDQIKILVLTNADEVQSQLKDFEPITVREYTEFL